MDFLIRDSFRYVNNNTAISLNSNRQLASPWRSLNCVGQFQYLSLRVEDYIIIFLGNLHDAADDMGTVFKYTGKPQKLP